MSYSRYYVIRQKVITQDEQKLCNQIQNFLVHIGTEIPRYFGIFYSYVDRRPIHARLY